VCIAGDPVVCIASDVCHEAGTCDSATGLCSNPGRVDGATCDDDNACTTNDACASGVCVGQGLPSPEEVDGSVQVSLTDGVATITWNPAVGSTWSAVLRGLVSQLAVGPGGDDEVCLDNVVAGSSTTDATNPDPDAAFWYLIRGVNACGTGPYGFEVEDGVQAPRVSATCP